MTDTITSRLPQIDAIIISSIIDAFSTSLSNSNQSLSVVLGSSPSISLPASFSVVFCAPNNGVNDAFAPPAVSSVAFDAGVGDDEIPFDIDAAAAAIIIIILGSIVVVLVDIVVGVGTVVAAAAVTGALNDPQQIPNSITASTAGSIADSVVVVAHAVDDNDAVAKRRPELRTIGHLPHLAQRRDHISHMHARTLLCV